MAGVEVDYTFGHQQSTYDGHEWGVNHLVTLRGRLGTKLNERVLVYLTGGLAGAKLDYSGLAVLPAPPAVQSEASAHKWGWTLGGGVEMETEQKVRLRAEALYVSLDRWRFDTPADLYTAQLDAWHFSLGVAVPLQ